MALQILLEAERSGKLKAGGTVVEGTAGSTGISLALLCRARGYRCVIYMPDDIAMEKEIMLTALGAEVRRVPAVAIVNSQHFVRQAERYAASQPNAIFANQFENTANFQAHFERTGPEIWRQTAGHIDAFVHGAGTGGTLAGVAAYLHEHNANIRIALADPPGSALYHKVTSGVMYAPQQAESKLQRNRYDTITEGIGIDRLTANFALALPHVTDAFRVSDEETVAMANYLLQHDGLFVGSSSAAHCVAAVRLARRLGPGHVIVTSLCDSGHRALSKLYNADYLAKRGLSAAGLQGQGVLDLSFIVDDEAEQRVQGRR